MLREEGVREEVKNDRKATQEIKSLAEIG